MDAGLHQFSSLHGMALLQVPPSKDTAVCFAPDSKFQRALLLQFNALDQTQISLLDFLEPTQANAAVFEQGRFTKAARDTLRSALEGLETFFATFSDPSYNGAFAALDKSLRTDTHLWNRYDNAVVFFLTNSMLQAWGEDLRTHKRSDLDDKIDLSKPAGGPALLRAYADALPVDAENSSGGFKDNAGAASHFYARDHGLYHEIKQRIRMHKRRASGS
jgi:hypothetical protein